MNDGHTATTTTSIHTTHQLAGSLSVSYTGSSGVHPRLAETSAVDEGGSSRLALSLRDISEFVVYKPVHILPPDMHLPPDINLTLLTLGTKFIPTTRYAQFTDSDCAAATAFVKDRRLRTPTQMPVSAAARKQLLDKLLVILRSDHHRLGWHVDNLSASQRATLRRLRDDHSFVVRNADKNLGLTLMSQEWYDTQVLSHLLDTSTYQRVNNWDVRLNHIRHMLVVCRSLPWPPAPTSAAINRHRPLATILPTPCPFYVIPKVHKQPAKSRPIAAANRYVTTPLSRLVTPLLQRMVNRHTYIVRNSTEFVRLLETPQFSHGQLPVTARLFSADVESLYPNMETDFGLSLIQQPLLEEYGDIWGGTVYEALEVVLRNLFVTYNDVTYHQVSGCAMGTPLAPPYANLFMHYADLRVRKFWAKQLALCCRYIDDYIGVWLGTELQFRAFTQRMNNLHPRIKIIFSDLSDKSTFLDLALRIEGGCVITSLHRKELNRYLYFPYKSQHPTACVRGWIVGELIRITRACMRQEDWVAQRTFFFARLRERGYPASVLQHWFQAVTFERRDNLLTPTNDPTNVAYRDLLRETPKVFLAVTYHPRLQRPLTRLLHDALGNASLGWRAAPSLGGLLVRGPARTSPE